jgi:hypothetical protein
VLRYLPRSSGAEGPLFQGEGRFVYFDGSTLPPTGLSLLMRGDGSGFGMNDSVISVVILVVPFNVDSG